MAMYAPPLKVSVTNHLGVGPLKSEAQGDNEVASGVGKVPWVEVAGRSGVPVRAAVVMTFQVPVPKEPKEPKVMACA